MIMPGKRSSNLTSPVPARKGPSEYLRTKRFSGASTVSWSNKSGGHGTSASQSRKSAALVGTVFVLLAAWNVHRGRPMVAAVLGSAGLALLLMASFSPKASQRFHRFWMQFAAALGFVNSRILLSAMYFLVFTPMGWIRRLSGRDPLMRRGPKRPSYWIPRKTSRQTAGGFERAF